MEENKRFKTQKLNEEDYEKTTSGAKAVKNGGIIISACAMLGLAIKKLGPGLIKSASKLIKH